MGRHILLAIFVFDVLLQIIQYENIMQLLLMCVLNCKEGLVGFCFVSQNYCATLFTFYKQIHTTIFFPKSTIFKRYMYFYLCLLDNKNSN